MRTGNRLTTLMMFCVILVFSACQSADSRQEAHNSSGPSDKAIVLTTSQRIDQLKSDLKAAKAVLTEAGEYDCCVHPACDWCLLHESACACSTNLKAGKKVCPGCGLGWHNGEGVLPGVDAAHVKWDIAHSHDTSGHGH